MSLKTRIILFMSICTMAFAVDWYWTYVSSPTVATQVAVKQLNDSNASAEELRAYETGGKNVIPVATGFAVFISFLVLFGGIIKNEMKKLTTLFVFLGLITLTGCRVPYDKPEFAEIENNETGFLLPLEGATSDQAKFASQSFLEEKKVATKRVQITHKWVQTGRWEFEGQYYPLVKLIKVNRSPIVCEWTDKPDTGSSKNDESIHVESRDSVGLSIGFNVTAMVTEPDAAKFLYWYSSGNLSTVMNQEVRGRVQKMTADECARYDFDLLRTKKSEISESIRKDVVGYFGERGITITSVGMVGGLHYENPEIQKAIDETVKKQQLKVIALAEFEAQAKTNERITLEADATAERARKIAKGEADAKLIVAQAEAEGIKAVNKALNDGAQSTLLFQIKQLDIEKSRIEKWNGQYPIYMMTMGTGSQAPSLMLQVPAAPVK